MTPGAALCARGWRLNSIHRRPRANLEASKINYSRPDYEARTRDIWLRPRQEGSSFNGSYP
jgi:hypothetical protein